MKVLTKSTRIEGFSNSFILWQVTMKNVIYIAHLSKSRKNYLASQVFS